MNKDSAQKQKPYVRLSADFQIRQSATLDWSRLSWENFKPDTSNSRSTSIITWLGVSDMSSFEINLELSKNYNFCQIFSLHNMKVYLRHSTVIPD